MTIILYEYIRLKSQFKYFLYMNKSNVHNLQWQLTFKRRCYDEDQLRGGPVAQDRNWKYLINPNKWHVNQYPHVENVYHTCHTDLAWCLTLVVEKKRNTPESHQAKIKGDTENLFMKYLHYTTLATIKLSYETSFTIIITSHTIQINSDDFKPSLGRSNIP